eukprot:3688011-Amphidinium_carterae.1
MERCSFVLPSYHHPVQTTDQWVQSWVNAVSENRQMDKREAKTIVTSCHIECFGRECCVTLQGANAKAGFELIS